jgi:translation initiation factor IF-2
MAGIKLADVAKKLGKSEDELKKNISEKGHKIAEDGTVSDGAVKDLGMDPKHLRLDRRQEMLKKAMERHKKHPRSREVKVNDGKPAPTTTTAGGRKKISKQELLDRKKKLESTIKKVDDLRESQKEEQKKVEKQPAKTVENTQPETPKQPEQPKVEQEKTPEKKPQVNTETKEAPEAKPRAERNDNESRDSRPPRRDGDRPQRTQGDRPPRRDGDRPQRAQGDRPPRRDGSRPPRRDGDRPQRSQGDRPPYRQQGDRPPRRDGDRPPYRQQGDRPPRAQGDRPPRRDGDRPPYRQQGDRPQRPGAGRPGVGRSGGYEEPTTLAEKEKKKTVTIKPKTDTPDKKKAVKPAQKKEKNIHKGVDEGIELFELEQEILKSDNVASEYKEPVEEPAPEKKTQPRNNNNNYNNYNRPNRGRRGKKGRREEKVEMPIVRPSSVQVGENIVVSELAKLMGVKATELIKHLMGLGVMASVNQAIDAETAQLLGAEYGIEVKVKFLTEDDLIPEVADKEEDLQARPPIVTVMGHVDHGKTSLLDCIRKTAVADGEAGGITQHIGAYEVKMEQGTITFLDTPGHEAFTTLRARGASVTDVVILVVAADDGVMPQTKEAIEHSKAAGVKLIVAVNKIDKENANPDMVKNQLAEMNVISEEWGGEYQFQEISAKQNINIDALLERVLLEAELLELKGNPDRLAEGIVIESKLDKQKGAVATVLINKGTLKKGDNFVVGTEYGKVRAMFNYKGNSIKEAGLSVPVEIMGFSGVPQSGDRFVATPDEKTAKQVASLREEEHRKNVIAEKSAVSLADLFSKIKEGELKELNIVLKADVQGSLEALKTSLIKLSNPEVKVNIISSGVGGISENDVILASASNAIVIGFNVRPGVQAKAKAEQEGIELNLYSVIYKAIDDIKQAMEGMLDPSHREEVIGNAEVRQVFSVPKIGKIAGSYVTDGKVQRNAQVRVVRDSIVIYDGVLDSLKRFQDDVKEVASGYECGIGIEKYNDLKEGDIFEFYIMVEEKRTLEDVQRDKEKRDAEEQNN